jgi:hypothetical protein
MQSEFPEKSVRLIEFAPALSTGFLVACLSSTKGFLPFDGSAGFAMALLTAALLCCIAAITFPEIELPRFQNVPLLRIIGRNPVLALLIACLIFQWMTLCSWYFESVPVFGLVPAFVALTLCAAQNAKTQSVKLMRWAICGALLLFVLCACLVIVFVPAIPTDVMVFQRDSSSALLQGRNPYALTFPDIYGEKSATFYGPGASVGGVLQFGFPYFPLTLLWVFPAQIFLGDFRFAYVFALIIAAACIFAMRRNPIVAASALLLLFSAPTFFVLHHGWTEPLPVMLLCAVAWVSRHKANASFIAVGLLAAAKQYLVLMLPLFLLLPGEGEETRAHRITGFFKTVGVTIIITLPFVAWDAGAFFHSAFFIQFAQPFRDSSLSYLSFFKLVTGAQPPSWPGFLVAIVALVFCLWRAPRTRTGFALSVALVMFGFVAFARQAFINYYFLVFGALCCATALAHSESEMEGKRKSELLTPPEAATAR